MSVLHGTIRIITTVMTGVTMIGMIVGMNHVGIGMIDHDTTMISVIDDRKF
jgi:hypothetical protein